MPNVRLIDSREYKLILASDRFSDRGRGVAALQDIVCRLGEQLGGEVERQQEEELRQTHYLDTTELHLQRAGFLLRMRFETDEFKISLKHRAPDRYLAAARDLAMSSGGDDLKFEEDILPPFRSLFSQSNSLRTPTAPEIENVEHLVDLFPGLNNLDLPRSLKLAVVNGFRPVEVFVKLCKVKFGDGPKIKCGLSLWYHSTSDAWPLISELAYDYEADGGDDFPLQVVEGANHLYASLQRQPGWFNPNETTKTVFAYEAVA
jgi:hypothetical protein